MKVKTLKKKLELNKNTIANLQSGDMVKILGGAATEEGSSCFPECQEEPGHTEYGDTCYEFCNSFFQACE